MPLYQIRDINRVRTPESSVSAFSYYLASFGIGIQDDVRARGKRFTVEADQKIDPECLKTLHRTDFQVYVPQNGCWKYLKPDDDL